MFATWLRLAGVAALGILCSAAMAAAGGALEILLVTGEPARYLPVSGRLYPLAGATLGLGAAAVLVFLHLCLRGSRSLLMERPASLAVAASLATLLGGAAALQAVFRSGSPRTAAILVLPVGAAVVVMGTAWLARVLPERVGRTVAAGLACVLLGIVVAAALGSPGVTRSSRGVVAMPPPGAPNVVVILIDTLRADHLSSYGYERPTSPSIDRLAAKGTRFENAYAQAPWTKPSVESLFTSRFVSEISGPDLHRGLPENFPTLAELFRESGYATAAFVANPVLSPALGFARGFDHYDRGLTDVINLHLFEYLERLRLTRLPRIRNRSDVLNRAVFRWLDSASARDGRPFLLYVHYTDPHDPYVAAGRFRRMFSEDGRFEVDLPDDHPDFLPFDAVDPDQVDPSEVSARIDAYDSCIRQNDEAIGQLMAGLGQRGVWDDSVVALLADHGEEFLDHGGWGHEHSLYDELIRVPLILRLPGDRLAGTVVNSNVMLVDVLPTLALLAGTRLPATTRGQDLLARSPDPEAVGEPRLGKALAELFVAEGAQRSVLEGPWKRIDAASNRGERRTLLFDLAADPAEQRDLDVNHGDPTVARARVRLENLDREFLDVAEALPSSGPEQENPELLRALRALGYVEGDDGH
jgi:arylsulfatase A-like enzyme